jgi:hypothetical protein
MPADARAISNILVLAAITSLIAGFLGKLRAGRGADSCEIPPGDSMKLVAKILPEHEIQLTFMMRDGLLSLGPNPGHNLRQEPASGGLARSEPIKLLKGTSDRQEIEVGLVVGNRSNRSVTILGGFSACTSQCCISWKNLPMRLGPLSRASLRVHLSVLKMPGSFDLPITLYTDGDQKRAVPLKLEGGVLRLTPES